MKAKPMTTTSLSDMEMEHSVSMQRTVNLCVNFLIALCIAAPLTAQSATATLTRTSAFTYDTSGLLAKEIIEPDDLNLCLVKEYQYDGYGNRTTTTTRNCNGSVSEAVAPTPGSDAVFVSRTDSVIYTYNADGSATTLATNALGQSETKQFEPEFGNLVSLTGPNNLTTTWDYDPFGRKTLETRADTTTTTWLYKQPCDLGNGDFANAVYCVATVSTGIARYSRTYYDALDRALGTTRIDFTNTVWVDEGRVDYDSLGRVAKSYLPYKRGSLESAKYTVTEYDLLNRVFSQTAPNNSLTTYAYTGLNVTTTNDLGQTQATTKDSQGQTVTVTDATNKTINYVYDPFGNLTHTVDAQGNTIVMAYDVRGHKTSMNDPDMGVWTFAYNALGELIRQTDAKGQIVTMQYDLLGRMVGRAEPDLNSTWVYDIAPNGIGKLASATSDNGYSRAHTYDVLGRPISTSTIIDNASAPYVTGVNYDTLGRVEIQTYPASATHPAGFAVKYVYSTIGYLVEVRDASTNVLYWQANTLDEADRVTQQTYGNGVVTTQVYDPATGRLSQQMAGAGNAVQNMTYQYDSLGNLQTRTDVNSNLTETFGYDNLNRVTIATAMSGAVNAASIFDYDALGNIVSKSDVGNYAYNPSGPNSIRPHAVASITGTINGVLNPAYAYDNNGNMVSGAGRTTTWTSFNMPSQIVNGTKTTGFLYNPEHERIKELQTDGSIVITLSPRYDTGLHFEKKYLATNGVLSGSVEYEHYLYAGGIMFGRYISVNDAAGVTTSASVEYYSKDHLGSIVAITDQAGAVIQRLSYDVWGKRRYANGTADPNGLLNNPDMYHGYTGHEMMDEVGLIHMNGRLYDPLTARFISADPYIQEPYQLKSYNRYAYVWNNPLRMTDPSGYCGEEFDPCISPEIVVTPPDDDWSSWWGTWDGSLIGSDFGCTYCISGSDVAAGGGVSATGTLDSPGSTVPLPTWLDWGGSINSAEQSAADWVVNHPTFEYPFIVAVAGMSLFPENLTEVNPFGKILNKVVGKVAKGAGAAEKGGLNLFKWGKDTTTKPGGWKEGDFMLYLPDQGSAKANWAQNAGRLREQMRQGNPIYDSYRDALTGQQIPTQGFLRTERNLLESRGWQYNPSTGAYHPPGQ